jgi:hypothetical protein
VFAASLCAFTVSEPVEMCGIRHVSPMKYLKIHRMHHFVYSFFDETKYEMNVEGSLRQGMALP